VNERRRDLLGIAIATMTVGSAHAASRGVGSATFGRAKQIRAGQLDVGEVLRNPTAPIIRLED
jgi:hypothetical protein